MKFARATRLMAALLAIALSASCGTERAPTAPASPQADLIGSTLGTVTGTAGSLLQCTALPAAHASKVIGPDGGVLQIGPHYLVVPPGALSQNITITGDAPSDHTNDVQFGPAGLQFAKPAALNMSYANCSLLAGLLPKIAYTSDLLAILYYIPSFNSFSTQTVTGRVDHFSRYAVSY